MVFQTGPAEMEFIIVLVLQYPVKSHLINVD
jgi:hypothetical protein